MTTPILFSDTPAVLRVRSLEARAMAARVIHQTDLPFSHAARLEALADRLSAKIAQVAK